MIFRDVTTGALLNIRHDDYINDRLYYMAILKHCGGISSSNVNIIKMNNISGHRGASESDYGHVIPTWVNSIISFSNNDNA